MRTIVITGSSRGIGQSLRDHYLQRNFNVVGISRRLVSLDNPNYYHIVADLGKERDILDVEASLIKLNLDYFALINNVGAASLNHFLFNSPEKISQIMNVNFFATVRMSQILSKLMIKHKYGRIINFSSVAVPLGLEGEAIYAASKSAIDTFSKCISKELGAFNITVNCIAPNPTNTALIKNIPEDKINSLIQCQALKRKGKFSDIANIADFFLSDASSFITAQTLYLGGIHE